MCDLTDAVPVAERQETSKGYQWLAGENWIIQRA